MISGFLTSVISSLRPRQHIEERLTLIVDFYHLLLRFLAAKRLINGAIESVPILLADKHARYISEIATWVGEVEKVTNELGDNGAHRCVDYCFCKRTAIISAAKVRHCKRKDCPDALFLCRENGGPAGHVFWHLHVLPPIRDLLYLIRNKVDC